MKKFLIALLAVLMLFLSACSETKEEYIEKCQDPQTWEEYEENPDEYFGKAYRIEGKVIHAVEVEDEDFYKEGYILYTFGLIGANKSEGRNFIVECYVTTEDDLSVGDDVIIYGDFVGMSDNTESLFPIQINGQYIEYIEKSPRV